MDNFSPTWLSAYQQNEPAMRQGWLAMLGSLQMWPREITLAFPGSSGEGRYAVQVDGEDEYLSHLIANAPSTDVWVGKRPVPLYHADVQDRIFFDVDSSDPADSLDQARALAYRIEEEWAVMPEVTFSAHKGYHLHLEHEPIASSGPAYRDVLVNIAQGWGVYPDPKPLGNGRSMPRAPYSLNAKSIKKFGEPLFVVPVDLSWDLDEIIQAAREIQVRRIKIPKAKLADLLEAPCAAIDEQRQRMSGYAMPDADKMALIQQAITFVENSGHRMRGKAGGQEGRRRLLYQLYIPALANLHPDSIDAVLERCQAFVEKTGGQWRRYEGFVSSTFRACFKADGILLPMRLDRWIAENADLSLQ